MLMTRVSCPGTGPSDGWRAWRATATALGLAAAATAGRADAPLVDYWIWVDVAVSTCSAATFEAPPDPQVYVANDRYRTAVVAGRVAAAGYVAPPGNPTLAARRATDAPLPSVNSRVSLALPRWDEATCKAIAWNSSKDTAPSVHRFRFNYNCDTLPRRGACLTPMQLVDLDDMGLTASSSKAPGGNHGTP